MSLFERDLIGVEIDVGGVWLPIHIVLIAIDVWFLIEEQPGSIFLEEFIGCCPCLDSFFWIHLLHKGVNQGVGFRVPVVISSSL